MPSSPPLVITSKDQQEFQAQQAQQAEQQQEIIKAVQQEAHAVWDLENQLDM